MTARIIQSAPTERSFMTRKSWQHPSRREHIHKRIEGIPDIRRSKVTLAIVKALKGASL